MTAPLSAFDEIRELRAALKRCQFDRDQLNEEIDKIVRNGVTVRNQLIEAQEECARFRRGLFAAGTEIDEITAQRNQARKELADVRADRDDLAQQVARLLGILPAVDEFHPETGAVRHLPEPS